jgi:hypothetical protein
MIASPNASGWVARDRDGDVIVHGGSTAFGAARNPVVGSAQNGLVVFIKSNACIIASDIVRLWQPTARPMPGPVTLQTLLLMREMSRGCVRRRFLWPNDAGRKRSRLRGAASPAAKRVQLVTRSMTGSLGRRGAGLGQTQRQARTSLFDDGRNCCPQHAGWLVERYAQRGANLPASALSSGESVGTTRAPRSGALHRALPGWTNAAVSLAARGCPSGRVALKLTEPCGTLCAFRRLLAGSSPHFPHVKMVARACGEGDA